MKKLNIENIDFNNKDITGTEWYFSFIKKDRPENWTINDEIMLLTLYLQKEIVGHKCGKHIHSLMDWRQNVSKVINETIDKLEDDNIFRGISFKNWQDSSPTYQSNACLVNINGDKLLVYANSNSGDYVLTDKGYEESEKDKMLHKAKELAKAELLAEQDRQKAIEEAEAEEQAEAEDVDIVIPFRNYGK